MSAGERLPGTPVPRHRWQGADGVMIAGDTWGDPKGPLVALLHGGGQTRHAWKGAGETLGESLADLNSDDMVILFGFRRRVATLPATLKLVLGSGARILYFTDQEPGTDGPATWTVRCPIRSADALDRYAGVMSLLHFHAMAVLREMGAKGRARLARIEQAHEALHEFA